MCIQKYTVERQPHGVNHMVVPEEKLADKHGLKNKTKHINKTFAQTHD